MSSALNSKKTIVISAVVFVLSLMPIESFAGKDWELITQLPSKRLGFVTVVVDDEIYLIGGSLFEDIKPGKRMPGPFGLSVVELQLLTTLSMSLGDIAERTITVRI